MRWNEIRWGLLQCHDWNFSKNPTKGIACVVALSVYVFSRIVVPGRGCPRRRWQRPAETSKGRPSSPSTNRASAWTSKRMSVYARRETGKKHVRRRMRPINYNKTNTLRRAVKIPGELMFTRVDVRTLNGKASPLLAAPHTSATSTASATRHRRTHCCRRRRRHFYCHLQALP